MGAFDTTTLKPIEAHGIYQSECSCRTAVNLYAGDTAPHCLSCGARVTWRMVQTIHSKAPVPVRPPPSGPRVTDALGPAVASTTRPPARPAFDSAVGD